MRQNLLGQSADTMIGAVGHFNFVVRERLGKKGRLPSCFVVSCGKRSLNSQS